MLRLLCLLRSAPCSVNASLSAARALLAQQNVYSEGVELPQDSTITDQAPMCGSTQHGPVPGQQQAPPAPQASSTSSSEIEALEGWSDEDLNEAAAQLGFAFEDFIGAALCPIPDCYEHDCCKAVRRFKKVFVPETSS